MQEKKLENLYPWNELTNFKRICELILFPSKTSYWNRNFNFFHNFFTFPFQFLSTNLLILFNCKWVCFHVVIPLFQHSPKIHSKSQAGNDEFEWKTYILGGRTKTRSKHTGIVFWLFRVSISRLLTSCVKCFEKMIFWVDLLQTGE